MSIEFTVLPKEGRGFFLTSETGTTYTSEVKEVWTPASPGQTKVIYGTKTPDDLGSQDILFVTENAVYALRGIAESGKNVEEIE